MIDRFISQHVNILREREPKNIQDRLHSIKSLSSFIDSDQFRQWSESERTSFLRQLYPTLLLNLSDPKDTIRHEVALLLEAIFTHPSCPPTAFPDIIHTLRSRLPKFPDSSREPTELIRQKLFSLVTSLVSRFKSQTLSLWPAILDLQIAALRDSNPEILLHACKLVHAIADAIPVDPLQEPSGPGGELVSGDPAPSSSSSTTNTRMYVQIAQHLLPLLAHNKGVIRAAAVRALAATILRGADEVLEGDDSIWGPAGRPHPTAAATASALGLSLPAGHPPGEALARLAAVTVDRTEAVRIAVQRDFLLPLLGGPAATGTTTPTDTDAKDTCPTPQATATGPTPCVPGLPSEYGPDLTHHHPRLLPLLLLGLSDPSPAVRRHAGAAAVALSVRWNAEHTDIRADLHARPIALSDIAQIDHLTVDGAAQAALTDTSHTAPGTSAAAVVSAAHDLGYFHPTTALSGITAVSQFYQPPHTHRLLLPLRHAVRASARAFLPRAMREAVNRGFHFENSYISKQLAALRLVATTIRALEGATVGFLRPLLDVVSRCLAASSGANDETVSEARLIAQLIGAYVPPSHYLDVLLSPYTDSSNCAGPSPNLSVPAADAPPDSVPTPGGRKGLQCLADPTSVQPAMLTLLNTTLSPTSRAALLEVLSELLVGGGPALYTDSAKPILRVAAALRRGDLRTDTFPEVLSLCRLAVTTAAATRRAELGDWTWPPQRAHTATQKQHPSPPHTRTSTHTRAQGRTRQPPPPPSRDLSFDAIVFGSKSGLSTSDQSQSSQSQSVPRCTSQNAPAPPPSDPPPAWMPVPIYPPSVSPLPRDTAEEVYLGAFEATLRLASPAGLGPAHVGGPGPHSPCPSETPVRGPGGSRLLPLPPTERDLRAQQSQAEQVALLAFKSAQLISTFAFDAPGAAFERFFLPVLHDVLAACQSQSEGVGCSGGLDLLPCVGLVQTLLGAGTAQMRRLIDTVSQNPADVPVFLSEPSQDAERQKLQALCAIPLPPSPSLVDFESVDAAVECVSRANVDIILRVFLHAFGPLAADPRRALPDVVLHYHLALNHWLSRIPTDAEIPATDMARLLRVCILPFCRWGPGRGWQNARRAALATLLTTCLRGHIERSIEPVVVRCGDTESLPEWATDCPDTLPEPATEEPDRAPPRPSLPEPPPPRCRGVQPSPPTS